MEVRAPVATEADTASVEATPEELAAPLPVGGAVADLLVIQSADPTFETSVLETATPAPEPLPNVGEALPGEVDLHQAEFAFLAGAIRSLTGSVGQSVLNMLRPQTRRRIQRRPSLETAVGGAPQLGEGATPTRESIISLFTDTLIAAGQLPSQETASVQDIAFATEVASVLEIIIGRDDRIRVPRPHEPHWRRICALRIEFPNGAVYRGTGFFISARVVATAGHCVYLKNEGGWARKIEVIPGADGQARPFGSVESSNFRSVVGWVQREKPDSDYGCIVLPSGSFDQWQIGNFGVGALEPDDMRGAPAVLAGYPGDKPFAEMWGMARRIKTINPRLLVYDIDTMGGQSGAPVYVTHQGQRVVVAIHRGGHRSGNSGARITAEVYARLSSWAAIT